MAAGRTLMAAAVLLLAACAARPPARPVTDVISPPRAARGNPPFYEVNGRRYHVLQNAAGYRERGVASWYGRQFHGMTTSSGESYDMNSMTAAHKTLPLPTWVEVTNLSNGRSVIVKVNDRGPFVANRLIDLSFAAAKSLDMVRDGTALVEVRALGAPAGSPPRSARPTAAAVLQRAAWQESGAADQAQTLYIQVGAYGKQTNAERMLQRLRHGGLSDVVVDYDATTAPPLYKVRLGPIADVNSYDARLRQLAALDIHDTHLVTAAASAGDSTQAGP